MTKCSMDNKYLNKTSLDENNCACDFSEGSVQSCLLGYTAV
jgi:hypothetical protein